MIMIKNVYFCVAKAKVDTPDGKFWLCLLGTDRLEIFFGLIRTAIGTDANIDLLQLASCGTHATEVQAILSLHPEWDHTPQRIKLPAVASTGELDSKVDHINPASCTGNLLVDDVNCLTSWRMGRRHAEEMIPGSAERFRLLSCNCAINILAPRGKLMVDNTQDDNEPDYRCTQLEAEFPSMTQLKPADPQP
ncbi:hypothetical protein K438DRAFT_2181594, partial [Mycena galopus ATCC 62051]